MIVFVRHGETDANRRRLALGRADPPLTERGVAQAGAVAARLADAGMHAVFTSPLTRARETAEAISVSAGVPLEVDDRLVELDYGEWDGLGFAALPAGELDRWRTDPSFAPPGGESLEAVAARVADFCAQRLAGPPVVAVSHVSPIKAAAAWALGAGPELSWRMFCDLASVTRITAPGGVPCLLAWNDTSHLA